MPEEKKIEEQQPQQKKLMKHIVQSTNLDWVAYDEVKKILYVQFKNGGYYAYYDVPKEIFTDLLKASSKGRYLAMKIKWKFEYKKLN